MLADVDRYCQNVGQCRVIVDICWVFVDRCWSELDKFDRCWSLTGFRSQPGPIIFAFIAFLRVQEYHKVKISKQVAARIDTKVKYILYIGIPISFLMKFIVDCCLHFVHIISYWT